MVKLVPVEDQPKKLRLVPVEQGTIGNKIGAVIDGIAQGATFNYSDEIAAGLATGFGLIGDYDERLKEERDRMAENKRLAGGYGLAGELAGAIGTGTGLIKAGISALPRLANAGLKTRAAAYAGEGAAYGAAYGSGAQEGDIASRAAGGLDGAIMGGAIGAATPAVGSVLRGAGQAAYNAVAPRINAIKNPQGEATRRVGEAFIRDAQMPQSVLNQADEASAAINNQQLMNFDRGGETVRALTRSVANQSPESRGIIEKVVSDRFASQGDRVKAVIDRVAQGNVDDLAFQKALSDTARRTNRAAYEKAYSQNFGSEHDMVFDELAKRIPAKAMADSIKIARAEGRPFGEQLIASIDEAANTVTFKRAPSMREWDYIQRGLRDATDSAYRSGNGAVGTAYSELRKSLLDAMDTANPAFKEARVGAAGFFGAEDALDAGRKFVSQNKDLRQSFRAIQKMNESEKQAFRVGFAAELTEKLGNVNNRRNVVNQIFGSDNARKKIELAFGREGAREFEQFVKVETAMDMMRGALGNSTTARQLVEMGLGAGGGYLTTGDITGAVAGAALTKGIRFAGNKAEENVMRKVADILISSDKSSMANAARQIAKSKRMQQALDRIMDGIEASIRAPAIQQSLPEPMALPSR